MTKVKLPGSDQSPSDIDAMDMVLNAEGTAFVETWKPIEVVREVAKRRYDKNMAHYINISWPIMCDEQQARDFLAGRITMEEATTIFGTTPEEKAEVALATLRAIFAKNSVSRVREEAFKLIAETDDPVEVLRISCDDAQMMRVTYKKPCPNCTQDIIGIPDEYGVAEALNGGMLGAHCSAEMIRDVVELYGMDSATVETPNTDELGDKLFLARVDFLETVGVEKIDNALNRVGKEMHCLWLPVDRTNTVQGPLKMQGFAIPEGSTSKTFDELMDERAVELWAMNTPLRIYWSGGLDSTAALVALLKNAPQGGLDRLTVAYTQKSIEEYPWFFYHVIEGNLKTDRVRRVRPPTDRYKARNPFESVVTRDIAINAAKGAVVTGEMGDQLFGSGVFARDASLLTMSVDTYLERHRDVRDEMDVFHAACPTPITSIPIMMWWWNFNVKWNEVKFRSVTSIQDAAHFQNLHHFFDTDDFQRWSIGNEEERALTSGETYKTPMRRYILDYTKDADYHDTKLKVRSLRVQWGTALGIDNRYNIIRAGETSAIPELITQRYGNSLERFKQ